jgi:hypothetical protein
MDSSIGNTQLILPNDVPHTVANVNFGLPHYQRAAAVTLPDGNVYFLGGFDGTDHFATVTRLNANTNTSTTMAPMTIPRRNHGATAVGNTIIVCAGKRYCVH